jgi:tetratricopeptide (TPR) repeat protein
MLAMAVTLVVAGTPPTGFTTAMERVGIARTQASSVTLEVDALGARIVLIGTRPENLSPSELCPKVVAIKGGAELHCTTRRLWAAVNEDKRGAYLDLRQLRGMPWGAGPDSVPIRAWPISALRLPDTCPGEIPVVKAECALLKGEIDDAKKYYAEGLEGPDAPLARLRLGDFALAEGDVEKALALYARIQPTGLLGRMAQVRECELLGSCLTPSASKEVAATLGVPEPLKSELELYAIRRELVAGRVDAAMAQLAERIIEVPSLCRDATALCQRLVRAGLTHDDEQVRANALSAYLAEEVRRGPYEEDLARVAANTAEALGAPVFAATVLSSLTPRVPREELAAHLLRITQLYLAGGDRVRAEVVIDYAQQKLGAAETSGAAWRQSRAAMTRKTMSAPAPRVERHADLTKLEADVGLSADLARAAALRSRAATPAVEATPGEPR